MMGLGGGFMHPRVGLATPYLSEEYMRLTKACVDEARRLGLEAWLYDEDRWPSGAAGGLVTKDPKFRDRKLRMDVLDPAAFRPKGDELAVFLAEINGGHATRVERVEPAGAACVADGRRVLAFTVLLDEPSAWFNGGAYLDTKSPEAVARFIEVTHERYAREIGSEFGRTVPGIFTDEPNHGKLTFGDFRQPWYKDRANQGGIAPWTDLLAQVFRDRYGYDLVEKLPELFYVVDGRKFARVRRDFHDCVTHLFVTSFARQIGQWCDRRGLLFTGHVLEEGTLRSQTHVIGAAMRFYEHMQAPGIDVLRGQGLTRPGGGDCEFSTAKQCASVQHQFGRTWMLSELYGCTGWHFTLAEHKAVGDWQAALGVNLRCHHLSHFTMQGEAKRDYPGSIHFQSPWWREYKPVEDYFARVGAVLTQGEPVRDLAVIHPIESAWGVYTGGDTSALDELDKQFSELIGILLEEHFDFDFVDEAILAQHGAVEADRLRVAKARYRAVLVPPLLTLRASTLKFLQDFAAAGGLVVFAGATPERVDGEPKAIDRLGTKAAFSRPAIARALAGKLRRASITTPKGKEYAGALYMLRHDEATGRTILFVCHRLQDKSSGPLTIRLPARGQAQEWDAATGEMFLTDARSDGAEIVISTELTGYGSRLFVVDPTPDATLKPRPSWRIVSETKLPGGAWTVLRDEPNAFPLDWPEFSINGGAWQPAQEILRIDRAVRDAAGLPHRGGNMRQPWAQEKKADEKKTPVALRYRFGVEALPSGPCHLVIEEPDRYRIALNGHQLAADTDEGWWIDTSFLRVRLAPAMLRLGENELVLETGYDSTSGLEAVYVTGEFGVRLDNRVPVITPLPAKLRLGDWRGQGFPFYTGAMTYVTEVEMPASNGQRVVLQLPGWHGTLAKVRVNGAPAGSVYWPPHEVDVTRALRAGKNRVEVEIFSSRRNLLGPLHLKEQYPGWTGPWQFTATGDEWTDDYVGLPYGMMKPPVIVWQIRAD